MHARTLARSTPIYTYIDSTNGYYVNSVAHKYRSRVSMSIKLSKNTELEAKFVNEATAAGLIGLKGHESVGGILIILGNG
jgi:phosphoserine aminotransferase